MVGGFDGCGVGLEVVGLEVVGCDDVGAAVVGFIVGE